MSYEIIYSVVAIRENDNSNKYLTLFIYGSNNCYEVLPNGRERRERNWSWNFLMGEPYSKYEFLTPEEIMGGIDAFYNSVCERIIATYEREKNSEFRDTEFDGMTIPEMKQFIHNHFGYYTSLAFHRGKIFSSLSVDTIKRKLRNAIAQAVTPDQLKGTGHPLVLIKERYKGGYDYEHEQKELTNQNASQSIRDALSEVPNKWRHIFVEIQGVRDEQDLAKLKRKLFPISEEKRGRKKRDYVIKMYKSNGRFFAYFHRGRRDIYYGHSPKYFSEDYAKRKVKELNNALWEEKYRFEAERVG